MKNHLYNIFEKWGTNVFVYSDPHFGDLESYKFRFVKNTEIRDGKKYYQTFETIWEDEESLECSMHEFDEMQIKNINSVAGKESTLIILGDVGDLECVKKLRAKRKILIIGNHDKGASNYKRQVFFNDNFNETRFYGQLDSRHISSSSYKELEDLGCTNIKEGHPTIEKDNHLFDEVYEGPLMINDRVILSHEPIDVPNYMFNIHGHTHNLSYKYDEHHLNCCAEAINYTPINLLNLFKNGELKHIDSIHRVTINNATTRNEFE